MTDKKATEIIKLLNSVQLLNDYRIWQGRTTIDKRIVYLDFYELLSDDVEESDTCSIGFKKITDKARIAKIFDSSFQELLEWDDDDEYPADECLACRLLTEKVWQAFLTEQNDSSFF